MIINLVNVNLKKFSHWKRDILKRITTNSEQIFDYDGVD